jgi:exo-beta-1,3-glucanase (GH17 family)
LVVSVPAALPNYGVAPTSQPLRTAVLRPDTLLTDGDALRASDTQSACARRLQPPLPNGSVVLGMSPDACAPGSRASRLKAPIPLARTDSTALLVLRLHLADRMPPSAADTLVARVTVGGETALALRLRGATPLMLPSEAAEPLVTTATLRRGDGDSIVVDVPAGGALEVRRIELALYPAPRRLLGIAYSPYRECQYPEGSFQPSREEIRSDLLRARNTANAIRVYSSRGPNAVAARLADSLGIPVFVGAWIDGPPTPPGPLGTAKQSPEDSSRRSQDSLRRVMDALEVDSLVALARQLRLPRVLVGSEYVLRQANGYGDSVAHRSGVTGARAGTRAGTRADAGTTRSSDARARSQTTAPQAASGDSRTARQRSASPRTTEPRAGSRGSRSRADTGAARRRAAAATYLATLIHTARARLAPGTEIGTAEIDDAMFDMVDGVAVIRPEFKPVLDSVDFVLVHIYPFWSALTIRGAVDSTIARYRAISRVLADAYPTRPKRLIVGETGWPAAGWPTDDAPDEAGGTLPRSARYLAEFLTAAELADIEFFYFTFADERWKTTEGIPQGASSPGQSWGLLRSDRTAKLPVASVLVPRAELPATVVVADDPPPPAPALCGGAPLCVYDEWPYPSDAPFLPAGFMGDTGRVTLFECDGAGPAHGLMAARGRVRFNGRLGWGGVAWLPAGRWDAPGVRLDTMPDLDSLADRRPASTIVLRFSARGGAGGERAHFGLTYHGGEEVKTDWETLRTGWREFELRLDPRKALRTPVLAAFWWSADRLHNPGRHEVEVLVDNIRYEVR